MSANAERTTELVTLRGHVVRRGGVGALPTGRPGLDEVLGGWPRPGIAVISGPPGSGRLSVLLPTVAALTRLGRPVAAVDPGALLYPPGLAGVALDRLLLVRAAPGQVGWVLERLLASGLFPLVLALEPPRLDAVGCRLRRAAARGRACLVLVSRRRLGRIPAAARLEIRGRGPARISLRVLGRGGAGGRELGLTEQLITGGMIR